MLESLRAAAAGPVAKILLGLLVISFAVWGGSGAMLGGTVGDPVTVGETRVLPSELRLAYLNRIGTLERQFNTRLTREQAKALGVETTVVEQVKAGAVIDETARRMGLGISDEKLATSIGEDPAFRDVSGRFSRDRLNRVLRSVGMSEDDYVQNQRSVAVRRQVADSATAGIEMPQAFFDAFAAYQSQRRIFDYVILGPANVDPAPEPTAEQLQAHYDANKEDHVAPEYRKLVILRLTGEDAARPDELTPEEVAAEYEAVKQRFGTPEKRRIQQLSMPDAAAAKAAADRLAAGESFDAILTEQGKTAADVDLGLLTKGEIPDANVANAAFGLEQGKASGVVEGIFGPVLLRVTEIQPEAVKPLTEVEAEVRKGLAARKGAENLFDIHDAIEDERAAGEKLAAAAAKVGLQVRTIEQVDRSGKAPDGTAVPDLPAQAELLAAAFETAEGVEADPVSIGSEGFVWYEVEGVTAERQKPLDEVRELVRSQWMAEDVARRVNEAATAIRDRVAKGEDLAAVAAGLLKPGPDGAVPAPKKSA